MVGGGLVIGATIVGAVYFSKKASAAAQVTTATIQSQINAGNALLPSGKVTLSHPLTIPDNLNTRIIGSGVDETILYNPTGPVFSVTPTSLANSPHFLIDQLTMKSDADHCFYGNQITSCNFGYIKTIVNSTGRFGLYFVDSLLNNIGHHTARGEGSGAGLGGLAITSSNGTIDSGNFDVEVFEADGSTQIGILLQGAESSPPGTENGKVNLNHFRSVTISSHQYCIRFIKADDNRFDFVDLEVVAGVPATVLSFEGLPGTQLTPPVQYAKFSLFNNIVDGYISVPDGVAISYGAASAYNNVTVPPLRISGQIIGSNQTPAI